ncbi:unnamed protein product [Musa acuminata subsp. malaccensis]|uniref:(wild Malaysian banana) hypothetical protein n=1 Tax=Musa acuminata subsp. malaccensis TaxID=214687 RepID=A0A804HYG2_MUSAM|nr:unnamed protein product [Musa acuminata subsp. malaccensis]
MLTIIFSNYLFLFLTGQVLFYLGKLYSYLMGSLATPTNVTNTTVALGILTSVAYFYAGLSKKKDRVILRNTFNQLQYFYRLTS